MIGDQYIPGDTTVLVPPYTLGKLSDLSYDSRESIHRNKKDTVQGPDCFEHAHKFIPERWYS